MLIDQVLEPQEPPTGPTSFREVAKKNQERLDEITADDDNNGGDYFANLSRDAVDGNLFVVSGLSKQGTINQMSQVTGVGSSPGSEATSSENEDGSDDEEDFENEDGDEVKDTSDSSGVIIQQQQSIDDAEIQEVASNASSEESEEE